MGWNWNCVGFEVSSGENVWRRVKRGDTVAGCDESVTDIGRIARQKENEQLYTGRHFPPKLVMLRRVLRAAWGIVFRGKRRDRSTWHLHVCNWDLILYFYGFPKSFETLYMNKNPSSLAQRGKFSLNTGHFLTQYAAIEKTAKICFTRPHLWSNINYNRCL